MCMGDHRRQQSVLWGRDFCYNTQALIKPLMVAMKLPPVSRVGRLHSALDPV